MNDACSTVQTLSVRDYMGSLVEILRSPSGFFRSVATHAGFRKPFMFLCVSALFNAVVSMSYFYENSLRMGGIYLVNAVMTPVIAAVFSFLAASASPGAKPGFQKIFLVHAYASGSILVVSWIPALGVFFELLRALLVVIGFKRACGMNWLKSCLVTVATAILFLAFIWSLVPVVAALGGAPLPAPQGA